MASSMAPTARPSEVRLAVRTRKKVPMSSVSGTTTGSHSAYWCEGRFM